MERPVLSLLLVACASCGESEKRTAESASAAESAPASSAANEDAPVMTATAVAAAAEVWAPGSVCTPNDVAILGSVGSASASGSAAMKAGAMSVSGRLPPEVIQRIVRSIRGKMRSCYEAGLASNPSLSGRVSVSFVIGRDGSVGSVSGGGDLPDAAVISCVTKAFYGLTFPKPEGGVVKVSYPVSFSPGP